jgi:DNA-binding NarL/FixJ family response regulator
LDVKERFFYKSHYHLKLRNSSGKYKMYLDQQMILSLDKKNKISKAIYNLSDISNSIKSNEHKLSFLDIRGIKSYYNVKSIGDFQNSLSNDPDFSKREIEVIRLISEGMTTKEISNHLFVSPDTIRTHRNNILKKSNEHKLTKVVKMCIKEGLI